MTIDHQKIINNYRDALSDKKLALAHSFISPITKGYRYLFGRNSISDQLSKLVDIDGFIDDYAEPGTVWNGKPVLKGDNISKNAIIVNCVLCARPRTAQNRIDNFGFSKTITYVDLCQAIPDIVPLPLFVTQTRMDMIENQHKWINLQNKLIDDESKTVLSDILRFRLTGDYQYLVKYDFRPWEQYFEPFMSNHENGIFIDCGGFDGDTTEEFCKRYPNYKKVYLFEPSITNLTKAKQRLQGFRDIKFMPLGVSNEEGKLYFNPDAGSASCVSDSGSSEIAVTTLDKTINEKVTFIKMDLEGWELKALQGSVKHIQEDHPKLAIAVYHHPSDFWRIPEFVLSIRDDYDLYLRHYTEGWTETIMYFVPHKA